MKAPVKCYTVEYLFNGEYIPNGKIYKNNPKHFKNKDGYRIRQFNLIEVKYNG